MAKHPVQKTGQLHGFLSKELGVRASVVNMTELVEDVRILNNSSPSSSVALGRLLVGSVLVASQLKDDQAISLQISGSGPIKKVFAHAQYDGLCRGYISDRQAPFSVEKNNISLKPLIGDGILQAITYIPKQKQPRTSQVQLQTSEIGEDIAYFLNQSMQIPSLVSLALKLGSEGRIIAAGGVLIELMPGHSESTLAQIENQQSKAQPLSSLVEAGAPALELLRNHLGDLAMDEVKNHKVNYGCTCSKEKAARSLHMLAGKDFEEIIDQSESLGVDCEMCGLVYHFAPEEMAVIFKESGKMPIH